MASNQKRNYSLNGPEAERAQASRLASAQWYESPIPRKRMKELMRRKNGPAIRDTILWLLLLVGAGYWAHASWGTWLAVPAFLVYGILYASPGDSRWHECGHGTAFKTPWMNEVVYQFASFLVLRPATPWRFSHVHHHSNTYIVGLDPEIAQTRPPVWRILLMEILHLYAGPRDIKRMFLHTVGIIDKEEKPYIPESEYRKTFWESRIYVLVFALVVVACFFTSSIEPAMFVVLPSFYGSILVLVFGIIQHLGLYEDVLDHRLNTRTVYMNPVFRFLYWNMNYHIEHHMFPLVPYHALPKLHEEMKADCPRPSTSTWRALKEVLGALWRQRKDPAYTIKRPLPLTANPYRYGPENLPAPTAADRHSI